MEEAMRRRRQNMRGRSGRRRIFGSRVVVMLGIGALALLLAMRMRRRAVEDTTGVPSGDPRGSSTQEDDTKKLIETVQQRGREKDDEVFAQEDTEGSDESVGEEIGRDNDPVQLGPLKGQPMMPIIRESVRRSRKES
jgi:hypothetical protein